MEISFIEVEEIQIKCEELTGLLDAMYQAVSNGDGFKYRAAGLVHILNMGINITEELEQLKYKLIEKEENI